MALTKIKGAGINISATEKLYFDGGGNTYIHESAADVLKLVVGGVAFMDATEGTNAIVFNEGSVDMDFRVESNGNANMLFVDGGNDRVGIGTASPNTLLQVGGTVRGTASIVGTDGASPYLKLDHTATTSGRAYSIYSGGLAAGNFDIYDNTASAARLSIDSSGRVGIGTSSPSLNVAGSTGDIAGTVLHIKDTSARADLTLEGQTGARLDLIDITGGSNTKWLRFSIEGDVGKFHSVNDNGAAFNEDNILVMDLASGKVGIGTTNPAKHLEVSAAVPTFRLNSTEGNVGVGDILGEISWKSADDQRGGDPIAAIRVINTESNGSHSDMTFLTGEDGDIASEKMRIDSSGKVGIGGSPSGSTLHLFGTWSSTSDWGITLKSTVGNGTAYMQQFRDGSNDLCGNITIATSDQTCAYTSGSDYRIKTNVEEMTGSIERLEQLKPYKYNAKKNAEGRKLDGFYAHELAEIIPEAVVGEKDAVDEDGEIIIQGVDYGRITPLLVSALQEAIERIEVLENA